MNQDWGSNAIRFLFTVVITTVLSIINWTGLEIVGNLSIVVCVISMSPFVIMCIMAIPKLDVSRWFVLPEAGVELSAEDQMAAGFFPDPVWGGVMWRPLLNSLFWNLNRCDLCNRESGLNRRKSQQLILFRALFFIGNIFLALMSVQVSLEKSATQTPSSPAP